MERDGQLYPFEIKKTALPDIRIVRSFGVLGKAPLSVGASAVLCTAERFGAIDKNNLIVPIWMI